MLSTYPEQIDLEEIMDNFINEIENSPYVLAVNIVLIVLTVLLMAVLRRFDAKDKIMKNFSRLTLSNFLLTSSRDIGILEEIKIWHDNFGVSRTWYLEKILIASEDKK
ncbi:hypothetical protein FSP39_010207 [Pinctada imbricata]|uniref:PLAT domain-containing protein n=1 Tax=Pinctada imbricata TaxID=66713 RepID=A0AA89BVP0_PINIB|nr:hypothetical protein FSP39_010207 [Pinctada imbricata]